MESGPDDVLVPHDGELELHGAVMLAFLKTNWKFLSVALLFIIAIGYTATRLITSFHPQRPPGWLQQQQRSSPGIDRHPRAQFRALLTKAEEKGKRLSSARFLELGNDPAESILWTTERILNTGFDPLARVETTWNLPLSELVGYYLLDGTPLSYTTRFNPNYPSSFPITVQLPQPLAPGVASLLVRRQRYRVELLAESNRDFQFSLPRGHAIPRAGGIGFCGVYLGPDVRLTAYKPSREILLADTNNAVVAWIEPANAPTLSFIRR